MRAAHRRDFWMILILLLVGQSVAAADAPALPGGDALWFNTDPAQPPSVKLYFFWSSRCPHCLEAQPFVEELAARYPWLSLESNEVFAVLENRERFIAMAALLGQQARSVPTFMVCGRMYVGWGGVDTGGSFLDGKVRECYSRVYGTTAMSPPAAQAESSEVPALDLPVFGRLDAQQLSLPLLTLVLAGMDAFNPCAFFVLLFLLSMLVHMRDRRMMLMVGGVFVAVSGLVYFAFMAAWLNLFLVFGEMRLVTLAAGIVAVTIALINIKDYVWFRRGVSLTLSETQKQKLARRSGALLNYSSVPALLLSTVLLAAVANTYELLCTAGFPMVYTRILTLNGLSTTGHYLYLALYNLIYVIPLLLIVLLFVATLGSRRLKESEGRILKLLSGLMMLALGLLLLLAPERLNNPLTAMALLGAALALTALVVWLGRIAGLNGGGER